jgi:crotonobetaine/carnitine-CoA ligase
LRSEPVELPTRVTDLGEGLTVTGLLQEAVTEVPDWPFLDFEGELYTFGQVEQLSSRFAHALRGLGITRERTVASILETSIDSVITWLGVNKAGGVWVPLNTAYKGDFLRHQLGDSDAEVVICDSEYVENVLDIAHELPCLRVVVQKSGPLHEAPADLRLRVVSLEEHRGEQELTGWSVEPSDLSLLVYTSGTTGPSKGCMISQNYMCSQGLQCNDAVPPEAGETMYTCLPLFHVSALSQIIAALAVKECLAISPRFSVSRFWAEIERSGARNALLMGSILPLLARADQTPEMIRCRGQLRAVTSVPVTSEVRRIWKERFGVEHINSFGYGLTEGSRLALHRYRGPDHLPPETSCGEIASDRFDVVILDDDDQLLPDGQVGEIAFRPRRPGVMFDGYWKKPEDTLAALRNLWMHSGDLGRIENGILFFVDRKKDYLRNRGENISSFEVERAFLQHPELVEVAVHEVGIGVAEDRMKVTAVRVAKSQLTEEELCRWAIQRLPYFAVPRLVEFRDDLPRTPTSKIMKFRLREDGVTASTWDREKAGIEVRRPAARAASSDTHDLGASRHRRATRPNGDRT